LYALEGTAAVSSQARSDDSYVDFEEAFARLERWVDEHATSARPARRRVQHATVVPRLPVPAPPVAGLPGAARGAIHGGMVAGATTAALAALALALPMTFLARPLRPSLAPSAATAATVAPSAPSVRSVPNVGDGSSLSRDAHGGPDGRPVGATDTATPVP
jgi:hypothetical protein